MTMEYGTIPGIEKRLSRLVQGTVPLSSADEAGSMALLDAVYEHGCRTFDTAHGYGGGDCERVLGAWIKQRRVRDEVVIVGKGAHPDDGRNRVTPEDIASDLQESLARLQVDQIDLYLLHRDDPEVPVGPIVEALNAHKRAGTIGLFGGSNWSTARIAAANAYAAEHDLDPFSISSPNFSLAVQTVPPWEGCLSISGPRGATERAWYIARGMPVFPWSSLAGGFFSGRFRRDNLDSFDSYLDTLCAATYGSEENFQRFDRVEALAARSGLATPQVAMAFVMSQPLNVFALVGCRTGAEFAMNAAAVGQQLSLDELAWLDLATDERPW